jgi:hypothetical protein
MKLPCRAQTDIIEPLFQSLASFYIPITGDSHVVCATGSQMNEAIDFRSVSVFPVVYFVNVVDDDDGVVVAVSQQHGR